MNKNNLKILCCIFFICIVIFSAFTNSLQAAINELYSGNNNVVLDDELDEKAKNSPLLEWIVTGMYYVACWIEDAVGWIFSQVTGTNEFPWADRVIFNAISFLDINFLNPEPGSLFLEPKNSTRTALANVIIKVYGSMMTLAIGFLGVAVAIMSIRLAISTIASEKAKYKQSIVKFCSSIALLFCVHYIIAIVFYVNERLVETASTILTDTVSELSLSNNLDLSNSLNKETLVSLYLTANKLEDSGDFNDKDVFFFTYLQPYSTSYSSTIKSLKASVLPFKTVSEASDYVSKYPELAADLIRKFQDTRYSPAFSNAETDSEMNWLESFLKNEESRKKHAVGTLAFDIWLIRGGKDSGEEGKVAAKNYIESELKPYLKIFADKTDEKIAQEYIDVIKSKIVFSNSYGVIDSSGINYPRIIYESGYASYKPVADAIRKTDFNFVSYYFDVDSPSATSGAGKVSYEVFYDLIGGIDKDGNIFATDWDNAVGAILLANCEHKNESAKKWDATDDSQTEEIRLIIGDKKYVYTTDLESIKKLVSKWRSNTRTEYYQKIYNQYTHYGVSEKDPEYNEVSSEDSTFSIITTLATYFKDAVWGYDVNSNGEIVGWRQNNFTVSGAIIYCVFLFQSLMFFLAYIRRFFYVTILAMFAPVVVLYDFMFGSH